MLTRLLRRPLPLPHRSFHTSAPRSRAVATSPVRAQEAKVDTASICYRRYLTRFPRAGILDHTLSLSMSTMPL